MTKFSGITPNTAPALADYLIGVTSGNVDFRATLQSIVNTLNASNKFNSGSIDWTTAGNIWWQELGRATLGATANQLSCSLSTTRKFLQVRIQILNSGTLNGNLQFNNDTGNNYAYQQSTNNAAPAGGTTASSMSQFLNGPDNGFMHLDILNPSGFPKSVHGFNHSLDSTVASTPYWVDLTGLWNSTSQITSIQLNNTGAGTFAIGTQMVILGHD